MPVRINEAVMISDDRLEELATHFERERTLSSRQDTAEALRELQQRRALVQAPEVRELAKEPAGATPSGAGEDGWTHGDEAVVLRVRELEAALASAQQERDEHAEALRDLTASHRALREERERYTRYNEQAQAQVAALTAELDRHSGDVLPWRQRAEELERLWREAVAAKREAFVAGFAHGVHNCDPLEAWSPEARYAHWLAQQPKEPTA